MRIFLVIVTIVDDPINKKLTKWGLIRNICIDTLDLADSHFYEVDSLIDESIHSIILKFWYPSNFLQRRKVVSILPS